MNIMGHTYLPARLAELAEVSARKSTGTAPVRRRVRTGSLRHPVTGRASSSLLWERGRRY